MKVKIIIDCIDHIISEYDEAEHEGAEDLYLELTCEIDKDGKSKIIDKMICGKCITDYIKRI